MSMTLQFAASDLGRAGLSVLEKYHELRGEYKWMMSYHSSGGGEKQDQPWLDPYCIVFDVENAQDIYFTIININNNPYCIGSTSNPDIFLQTIQLLIRNSIPFQIS